MYLSTIKEQLFTFLYSCGFGFLLGALYDFFTFFLLFLPKKKAFVIADDVIYMIVCTFLTHLFSLSVDNGGFKMYIYMAFAIGWLMWYFTFGFMISNIKNTIAVLIKRIFLKIKRTFLRYREKLQKNSKKNENS